VPDAETLENWMRLSPKKEDDVDEADFLLAKYEMILRERINRLYPDDASNKFPTF